MSDVIDFADQDGCAVLSRHSLRTDKQKAAFERVRAQWEQRLRTELSAELPTDAHVTAALHVIYHATSRCCATPWQQMPTYVPKLLNKLSAWL